MLDFLLSIWNSPFWDKPVSAFVVPFVVISYFWITYCLEKRQLRLSRAAFATGWDPVKGTMYRHKYLPWRKCYLCYTHNSPNDKFCPSVFVDIVGSGYEELPASVFRSRYKEITNVNTGNNL